MQIPNRLQVGIDVSKQRLDLAVLAADGQPIEQHQAFPNTWPGYQQAQHLLLMLLQEHGVEGVDIAAEATSYYWLPVFIQLSQSEALARYDLKLYLLNARWVRWYKQSLSPDHKDDLTDPEYIADRIRTRRPASDWHYDPKWLSLRLLTRAHWHLSKGLTREKNLYQLYLFLIYTTYAQQQPFTHVFTQISRKLLAQPGQLEQLAGLGLEEIAEQLSALSGQHLASPLTNAAAIQHVLQDSFPVPEGVAPSLRFLLQQIAALIVDFETRLRQVDQQIESLVQSGEYPEVSWLASIPGVGPVLSAGLAAEIGGLERFQRVQKWDQKIKCYRLRRLKEVEDAIGKLAGLWWPKKASGQFEAEERHLTKEGNAYLRYYILEAADRMRQWIPSYKAYYRLKYEQAYHHKHKRALVLLGRKALGLFVGLLYHQESYRAKEGELPLG